jgi:transposase
LLAAGETLVRVPPKLMAPERRSGRMRGKSEPIDALAVARAALREQRLDRPRPGEAALRELKLLVDHRDDLVDERRRAQKRLRWQLHDLEPELTVPPGALDRTVWLDRVARRLARAEQTMQIRIARELVGRCRSLTRTILRLDRELQARTEASAAAAHASWLWPTERRQAARRDQPDRTLPDRRAASYDTVVIPFIEQPAARLRPDSASNRRA